MNHSTLFASAVLACLLTFALTGCGREHAEHAHSKHEESHHDESDHHESDHHESDAPHDDQTTIGKAIADEVGIRVAAVGPGAIRDAHEVQGLLTPVEGKHARIRARFPGPILAVRAGVGDVVKAGQTLAVIESNVSMSNYSVTAPFAGTILDRTITVGDQAGDAPLFELADLSSLWVDLHLFGGDAQHISAGLAVEVIRLSDGVVASTKLDRILPGTATASQSTVARATIPNTDGRWRPGTAVRARVTVSERRAELVVPLAAVQAFEGEPVVFVNTAETYAARRVRLGERDSENVEVLAGLDAGEMVVVAQSYLIKSDLEKAGATHEH